MRYEEEKNLAAGEETLQPCQDEIENETEGPEDAGDTPEQEPEPELSPEERLQKELGEQNDRYLRLMAEYDNFRKRTQREKDDLYAGATASTVEKFLPVWDNFQRAAEYEPSSEDFAKGFELIRAGFEDVLKSLGVEPVGQVGEDFDPAIHYAVSHIEDDSLGENVVSQVLQPGYKIKDRIIRYAMVQTAN